MLIRQNKRNYIKYNIYSWPLNLNAAQHWPKENSTRWKFWSNYIQLLLRHHSIFNKGMKWFQEFVQMWLNTWETKGIPYLSHICKHFVIIKETKTTVLEQLIRALLTHQRKSSRYGETWGGYWRVNFYNLNPLCIINNLNISVKSIGENKKIYIASKSY